MKSRRFTALIILVTLLVTAFPQAVHADKERRLNMLVTVDGADVCTAMAVHLNYENNIYVSMKDIAYALRSTSKAFTVDVSSSTVRMTKGVLYDGFFVAWSDENLDETGGAKAQRNEFYVDDVERKYYTIITDAGEMGTDAFISPLSLAMILDISITVDDDRITIDTGSPYSVSGNDMDNSGYMQGINAALAGDGTTGAIYYEHNSEEAVPIASTTKLMTYYVLMDAVENGEISLSDSVRISKNAEVISGGIDGVIQFSEGQSFNINDLIKAMLILSSNESALALAEHVAGTEEAFVERMNNKAAGLGLTEAYFYNCNGLPVYDDQLLPAKMQNHMSAKEMFVLASDLVRVYPEVLEITSLKMTDLSSIGMEAKTTNALLYNMDEVKGLKTGTTNKSGACLVTCMPLEKDGERHNVITVLFGAETEVERATTAEILARFAENEFYNGNHDVEEVEEFTGIPSDPEMVVEKLIKLYTNR